MDKNTQFYLNILFISISLFLTSGLLSMELPYNAGYELNYTTTTLRPLEGALSTAAQRATGVITGFTLVTIYLFKKPKKALKLAAGVAALSSILILPHLISETLL